MNAPGWIRMFGASLIENGWLPEGWQAQIRQLAEREAIETILDASSPTSLERPGTKMSIRVVNGDAIRRELPWLYDLYGNELCNLASSYFGKRLFPSKVADDGVNINVVSGEGGRYEWHVDTNPVTGLLFVDTFSEGDGGALVFRRSEEYRVYPRAGLFLCFDAREVPHRVEPVTCAIDRISIPMNFYEREENEGRGEELNNYLGLKK